MTTASGALCSAARRLFELFSDPSGVCWIGLGDEGRGDDAAGLVLARKLVQCGIDHVYLVGISLERWLHRIVSLPAKHVVFLDAVQAGLEAGSIVFGRISELKLMDRQVGCHRVPLGLVAAYLEREKLKECHILGIQIATCAQCSGLSGEVLRSVHTLAEAILRLRRASQ